MVAPEPPQAEAAAEPPPMGMRLELVMKNENIWGLIRA
jgi:hypothetical protein